MSSVERSNGSQGVGGSCFNHFCFRFKVVGHAQLPPSIHQSKQAVWAWSTLMQECSMLVVFFCSHLCKIALLICYPRRRFVRQGAGREGRKVRKCALGAAAADFHCRATTSWVTTTGCHQLAFRHLLEFWGSICDCGAGKVWLEQVKIPVQQK